MTSTTGSSRSRAIGVSIAIAFATSGVALAGGGSVDSSAVTTDGASSHRASTEPNSVVLANQILDRWQPIAERSGAGSQSWREMYFTQLSLMDLPSLRRIDQIRSRTPADAKIDYARFTQAFLNAQANRYMTGTDAATKSLKLGSTTTDQVFIPIVPCRVVDTRVGSGGTGPIAASTQRAFFFYSAVSNWSWQTSGPPSTPQGGAPGQAVSVCPGTTLTTAGGTLGNVAPSAAMATITVVSPTAAGNLVAWGGAGTFPQSTVVNFTAGQNLANTTVIPGGGRTGAPVYDFTVRYNGPSGQADVVVDVVGYFVENTATALQCVYLLATGVGTIGNTGQVEISTPICGSGYTKTGTGCSYNIGTNPGELQESSPDKFDDCVWYNNTGASVDKSNYNAESVCCRVPGQ